MMRSAADFLPSFMTTFMNFASISLLNFGSGRMVRTGACARRDISASSHALRAGLTGFAKARTPSMWRRAERAGKNRCAHLLLGPLGSVFRATLLALAYASAIKRAANRVVADAWQVLYAASTDEHHRVLLEVVSFATDVARDFISIGQPNTADLPQGGVGLLRRRGVHACADA